MCSMCGADRRPPRAAFASSAARWRTPKRCCSSTTATAERAERDVRLDQRVRADDQRQLAAGELAERVGAAPGARRSIRSAARSAPARRRSALWTVAKCCSASVSVGAIRAAWCPCSTARSIACSATTVLPRADLAHQQPLHRPRSSPGRRRSPRSPRSWSPVSANGSPLASQRALSVGGSPSAGAPRSARRRARRRRNSSWASSSSSKARRSRARSDVLGALGEVHRRERGRADRAAARRRGRARAAARSTSRKRPARAAHEREDLRRGDALAGRVVGDGSAPSPAGVMPASAISLAERVVRDAEAARGLGLAVQHEPRAGRIARARATAG